MNRYIKAAAMGAAITLGACATSSGTPATTPAGTPTGTPAPTAAAAPAGTNPTALGQTYQWATTISPEGGSGISGTAAAVGDTHQTHTTVSLSGAMAGAVHPWHIHAGQCGSNGAIVGPPASYPPLKVASDGTASASAVIVPGLETGSRYYVNIHKSSTEMGTIVGCGDLTRAGM